MDSLLKFLFKLKLNFGTHLTRLRCFKRIIDVEYSMLKFVLICFFAEVFIESESYFKLFWKLLVFVFAKIFVAIEVLLTISWNSLKYIKRIIVVEYCLLKFVLNFKASLSFLVSCSCSSLLKFVLKLKFYKKIIFRKLYKKIYRFFFVQTEVLLMFVWIFLTLLNDAETDIINLKISLFNFPLLQFFELFWPQDVVQKQISGIGIFSAVS